jgi:hypothetical protein
LKHSDILKGQNDTKHFTNLQRTLYDNLIDILGFQIDTPKLHEKFKNDKEELIKYIEAGKHDISDQETINRMMTTIKLEKDKVGRYPKIVYTMSLIYSIAHFEAFLNDTIKKLLELIPKALISRKQMSYEEILKYNSKKEIIDSIIERELMELTFKNISDQIEYLSLKFKIQFKYVKGEATWGTQELDIEKLRELYSLRNIILHNNGIINNKFLKDNPNSSYGISQKIELTEEEVTDALILLMAIAHKISYRASQKVIETNE